jgi:hypothetical protein
MLTNGKIADILSDMATSRPIRFLQHHADNQAAWACCR